MVNSNITTVTLDGSETAVHFNRNYPYFWVQCLSGTVLVSINAGIVADADGVFTVSAGTSCGTMHAEDRDTVYLSGDGKAQVCGTYSAHSPFKSGGKGGESNASNEDLRHIKNRLSMTDI